MKEEDVLKFLNKLEKDGFINKQDVIEIKDYLLIELENDFLNKNLLLDKLINEVKLLTKDVKFSPVDYNILLPT